MISIEENPDWERMDIYFSEGEIKGKPRILSQALEPDNLLSYHRIKTQYGDDHDLQLSLMNNKEESKIIPWIVSISDSRTPEFKELDKKKIPYNGNREDVDEDLENLVQGLKRRSSTPGIFKTGRGAEKYIQELE